MVLNNGGPNNNNKKKNMQNSGHLRLCQQPRAAHALRSDQHFFHPTATSIGYCKTFKLVDQWVWYKISNKCGGCWENPISFNISLPKIYFQRHNSREPTGLYRNVSFWKEKSGPVWKFGRSMKCFILWVIPATLECGILALLSLMELILASPVTFQLGNRVAFFLD